MSHACTAKGARVAVGVASAERDRAYFRTYEESGKFKRLRRRLDVAIAPSTVTGRVTGRTILGRARLLTGAEDRHAARLIERRHPLWHLVVRVYHRLAGYTTRHFEVARTSAEDTSAGGSWP